MTIESALLASWTILRVVPLLSVAAGCAGVAMIPELQDKLIRLARGGFKHHTSVGVGHQKDILKEAFTTYLHYDWVDIDS